MYNHTSKNIVATFTQATQVDINEGVHWYSNATSICKRLSNEYDVSFAIVAGVVAALSPNNKWDRNIYDAEQLIRAYCFEYDYPKVCTFSSNKDKAISILECDVDSSANICAILKGNKTIAFFRGIFTQGICDEITVDGHAFNIWRGMYTSLKDVPSISNKLYKQISEDYKLASKVIEQMYGVYYSPTQIQAVTWVTWRRINNVV